MTEETQRVLESRGGTTSPLAQAALVLAARLDNPAGESGTALAAVVRQLDAVLRSPDIGPFSAEPDPIDILRRKREARAASRQDRPG